MQKKPVRARTLLGFVTPFAVLFLLFQVAPLIMAARTSLFDVTLLRPDRARWAGVGNYADALSDAEVLNAFKVSAVFTIAQVVLQVPLSLGLAVLVNKPFTGRGIVRAAVFLPVITSTVIVSVIWLLLYDPSHGLLNAIFRSVGLPGFDFLTSSSQALPGLVVMSVWQNIGISMVIYLGALQSVDPNLVEAATVDGAGPWRRFVHLILPLVQPSTFLVVVITTVNSFKSFAPAYVMTKGGPSGATDLAVYLIYRTAFISGAIGYASALSIILMTILVVISLMQSLVLRTRWER